MTNILKAIYNISQNKTRTIKEYYKNNIKIQQTGDSFEEYIKNIFTDSFKLKNQNEKDLLNSKYFSYLGNANNPPDLIIKSGDAIEIKKIESFTGQISLNSSFPKDKLYCYDKLITQACRNCENWNEKDLVYIIGTIQKNELKKIWFTYGNCYCANENVYLRIKNSISKGINELENIEFSETNELGRINKVDPLGITYFRIRGMWGIEHPSILFKNYILDYGDNFLNAIILKEKFLNFPKEDIENLKNSNDIIIKDIKIRNPNNPALLLEAMYIGVN